MGSTRKPLSDAERASLLQQVNRRPDWGNAVMGWMFASLVMLGAVSGVGWLVGAEDWHRSFVISLVIPFGVGIVVAAWLLRNDIRDHAPQRERAARLLAAGEVDEETLHVVDAIEVEETEDEGPHYYLALRDGRVLFLSGQYLLDVGDDPDDEESFPRATVVIRRSALTREILDVRARGKYVAPSTTRPPFTAAEQDKGVVPPDDTVLSLPFDSLRTPAA